MSKTLKLPSLSVVVPVYNEGDDLAFCLESLLAQADDIHEIIVIDNNSTDGSLAVVRRYAKNWPIIKVLQEKAQGLVPTRNRGFLAAKGDITARIDADTRVSLGWALAIRRYFGDHPSAAALRGDSHYYDLPFDRFTAKICSFILDDCNRAVSGFASLYGSNMAIKTSVAKELAHDSCFGNVNEDLDLTIHIVEQMYVIGYQPDMLAYVSGRRFKSSPVSFFHYCINWPRTYARHKLYGDALRAMLFTLLFCAGEALIFLPARAYDPESFQMSLKRLRDYNVDRIIP